MSSSPAGDVDSFRRKSRWHRMTSVTLCAFGFSPLYAKGMTYFCSPARQRKNHRKLLPGEARFKRPSYPIVSVLGFDVGRVRGRRLDHGLQVRHLVLDGVDLLHLLGVVHDDHVGPGALQHVLHRFGRVGRINTGNDATGK